MAFDVSALGGKEIADDFIRKEVPTGRWSYTWDVFKSNFLKILLINIFVLISVVPAIVLIVFRNAYLAGLGTVYPFNTALSHPFVDDITGMAELVVLSTDLRFYSLLILAGFIASVGVSGAVYSLRKLLQTHGEFSVKSFFHGVKVGYFNTVFPITVFLAFFLLTKVSGDWRAYEVATGGSVAGATTAYVFAIIANVLVGIYMAWVLAVGTSYRVGPLQLLKNSFVFMIGTPIQTVFIAGFALIPVWLYLIGGIFVYIAYFMFILVGFSFILLCWTSFTQWVFDKFITPVLKTEKEAAQAKKTPEQLAAEQREADKEAAMELLAAGKSALISKPVLPISDENKVSRSAATFSRADIAAADEGRAKLAEDIAAYEKEHENDPVYKEYNKMFEEREKALQTPEKDKKKRKVSANNLLH